PVVWSCRGNLDEQALIFGAWKKKPVLWLIKHFLSGPRITFHTTSPEESGHVGKIFGRAARIVEIPNYLELPTLLKHAAEHPPYLLYVGRIHPVKALDNLLDALALSKQFSDSEFVLKIAGEDATDYGVHLKKKAEGLGLQHKVHFLGQIEGAQKQRLYANAHFTVLPSHTENFGNVVIESLAQATPVIASRGTPWQMLETEQAGFWVPNDPENLAIAINKALTIKPNTYKLYRENAIALVRRRFDIESNVHVWINAYQAILLNPSKPL
ncbi:MAG TPA: glycosyltransferase, partial [Saprospiraceae bacterium]|nr:glycosyltransferase [Saprospiraceae bacterium]